MVLNKDSLETLSAFIEQSAVNEEIETPFQFERHGYFILANKTNKNKVEFGKIIHLKIVGKMLIVCDKDYKVSGKLKIRGKRKSLIQMMKKCSSE